MKYSAEMPAFHSVPQPPGFRFASPGLRLYGKFRGKLLFLFDVIEYAFEFIQAVVADYQFAFAFGGLLKIDFGAELF